MHEQSIPLIAIKQKVFAFHFMKDNKLHHFAYILSKLSNLKQDCWVHYCMPKFFTKKICHTICFSQYFGLIKNGNNSNLQFLKLIAFFLPQNFIVLIQSHTNSFPMFENISLLIKNSTIVDQMLKLLENLLSHHKQNMRIL